MPPERLSRWADGFAARHGGDVVENGDPQTVSLSAPDGALAQISVPFPPMREPGPGESRLYVLLRHASRPRRLGLLLVRRGGHAVGVFEGAHAVTTKSGRRHVQGRSAAGGWSQQRFARRREGQAAVAANAAADAAFAVLVDPSLRLDALVTGGDRAMVAAVLADPRLAPLRPLVAEQFLAVPDPRKDVLLAAATQARSVRIRVVDPDVEEPR